MIRSGLILHRANGDIYQNGEDVFQKESDGCVIVFIHKYFDVAVIKLNSSHNLEIADISLDKLKPLDFLVGCSVDYNSNLIALMGNVLSSSANSAMMDTFARPGCSGTGLFDFEKTLKGFHCGPAHLSNVTKMENNSSKCVGFLEEGVCNDDNMDTQLGKFIGDYVLAKTRGASSFVVGSNLLKGMNLKKDFVQVRFKGPFSSKKIQEKENGNFAEELVFEPQGDSLFCLVQDGIVMKVSRVQREDFKHC